MNTRTGCSSIPPPSRGVSTLSKNLQRRISELQAERQIIFENCPTPILFVSGRDELICEANAAAAELFGKSIKVLIGSPFQELLYRDCTGYDPCTQGLVRPVMVRLAHSAAQAALTRVRSPNQNHPIRDMIILALETPNLAFALASRQKSERADRSDDLGPISQNIIGRSEAIRNVCRMIGKVAKSDSTVLILGESGTGKEVCAKAIHMQSNRAARAFVGVNCAALSESLLESELFGHVKGAFTGAIRDRVGRFRQADKGTILLDEIGAMSLEAQSRLLRVLQERRFEVVGSSKSVDVDVRVIATTNVDLKESVAQGSFREDLYYRLNVIAFTLPPLRQRREDIPLLVEEFVRRCRRKFGNHVRELSPEAQVLLLNHPWPGNVRQLENTVERAMIMEDSNVIQSASLGLVESNTSELKQVEDCGELDLRRQLKIFERHIVLQKLKQAKWVRKSAAEQLGIDPKNLNYFLRKHNISATARLDTQNPPPVSL